MVCWTVLRRATALLAYVGIGLAAVAAVPAQAKWYVDNKLGDVPPAEKITPSHPKPVQLLFEFERDGKPNAAATKLVAPWALDDVKATGVFSDVATTPAADGAVLGIQFDNVVKRDDLDKAKKEAFRAGLGFGLFGGVVATDHYVVTLNYVAATGAKPITVIVEHAIHMKYGNSKAEVPGVEVKNVMDAMKMVVRQALDRGVNNVVADPTFPK